MAIKKPQKHICSMQLTARMPHKSRVAPTPTLFIIYPHQHLPLSVCGRYPSPTLSLSYCPSPIVPFPSRTCNMCDLYAFEAQNLLPLLGASSPLISPRGNPIANCLLAAYDSDSHSHSDSDFVSVSDYGSVLQFVVLIAGRAKVSFI